MNLSEVKPLQVMLSSRSSDKIMFESKSQDMSVLRRASRAELESLKIGEVSFFKVWIHEDDPFRSGDAETRAVTRREMTDLITQETAMITAVKCGSFYSMTYLVPCNTESTSSHVR